MHTGLHFRPFDPDRDTDELVRMWRASFEHGVGVTDPHPVQEQTAFLLEHVVPTHRVVVAHDESGIVGFLAATDDSVGQLYVRVDRIGQGIGSTLLDRAKRESSGRLWLYTFARNHHALSFYAHHGFVEAARGFEQTWQLEDVLMEWTRPAAPARPLSTLLTPGRPIVATPNFGPGRLPAATFEQVRQSTAETRPARGDVGQVWPATSRARRGRS